MITSITARNFRSIEETQDIALGPITVLTTFRRIERAAPTWLGEKDMPRVGFFDELAQKFALSFAGIHD